ncbi:MAG TPA: hypothetical protein VM889_08890 [Candidatus Thermoplasmatota archaeon]|nr:hypothetical protein [Candidatus Thermoplasmatota archaeon]
MILPGAGGFVALFGWWNNANGDPVLEIKVDAGSSAEDPRWNATNEWIPKPGAAMLAYVEPGSRPRATTHERPSEEEPDLVLEYTTEGHVYVTGKPSLVLFPDGSLLQAFETLVVSDAWRLPSAHLPFTPKDGARVDRDRYAAVAPGPAEAVYGATLAPTVNAVGSPSYGSCPNGCEATSLPATGTAADDATGAAARVAWAPYPREWMEGSGASAAGRRAAYLAEPTPWVDLLPKSRVLPSSVVIARDTAPLLGGGADGAPTMAPGFFTVDLYVGLHLDLDGDGFVGRAPRDPHEGGRRPIPDRYFDPAGEFLAMTPILPDPDGLGRATRLAVTLVPDTDWGDGVVLHDRAPAALGAGGCGLDVCPDASPVLVTGGTPITLTLRPEGNFAPGRWVTLESVLMPHGSPGFTACVEPMEIRWTDAEGAPRGEIAWDCDRVPRWTPSVPVDG